MFFFKTKNCVLVGVAFATQQVHDGVHTIYSHCISWLLFLPVLVAQIGPNPSVTSPKRLVLFDTEQMSSHRPGRVCCRS